MTWTVNSSCAATQTCSASFTVTNAPAVSVTCAQNQTEAACQTQAAIDGKFATWLTTFNSAGGCNREATRSAGSAPLACGGSTTITWTVTSSCAATPVS